MSKGADVPVRFQPAPVVLPPYLKRMTLAELKEKLQAELQQADKYVNSYEGPFTLFGSSPDYIRGGKDALIGVLKLLDQLDGS